MEFPDLLHFAYECIYFLVVFGVLFLFTLTQGRQAMINVLAGLYLALLLSIHFPYYNALLSLSEDARIVAGLKILIFLTFTIFAVWLFYRIMPSAFLEGKFESFGKKIILALGGTILVMVFSFSVLPVTEFLNPGTPLQSIFAPSEYFFWWLLLPLVILVIAG